MTSAQLSDATRHLEQTDPVLSRIIPLIPELGPIAPSDPWWELVDSIVSQQLSVKAAATILGRLEALTPKRPGPSEILSLKPEQLRGAGLSNAKVNYLRDLAERITDERLNLGRLSELSDEDVIATLTEVRGIGRWTAEMYLIFQLGRPDVLPVDDLGFREAVKRAYRIESRPEPQALIEIGERWRPYRSVATRYLWKSLALDLKTDLRARPTT